MLWCCGLCWAVDYSTFDTSSSLMRNVRWAECRRRNKNKKSLIILIVRRTSIITRVQKYQVPQGYLPGTRLLWHTCTGNTMLVVSLSRNRKPAIWSCWVEEQRPCGLRRQTPTHRFVLTRLPSPIRTDTHPRPQHLLAVSPGALLLRQLSTGLVVRPCIDHKFALVLATTSTTTSVPPAAATRNPVPVPPQA